jgi:hypothetical protein
MVKIVLEASARLRASARDPKYTAKDSDLPSGIVEVADYPRIGEFLFWPETGRQYTIHQVAWGIGNDCPLVVLD